MKTFQLTLTAMLLLGLTTAAFAQMFFPDVARMNTPAVRQADRNMMNSDVIDFWNGNHSFLAATGILQDEDFQKELGITKEQLQTIQDFRSTIGRLSFEMIDGEPHMTASDPDVQLLIG